MDVGDVQLGNASLHLGYSQIVPGRERGLLREITEFNVPEEHRGKGEGTSLLQDVCEQADYENLHLMLIADTPRLKEFYSRFGFKSIQDEGVILMLRKPQ